MIEKRWGICPTCPNGSYTPVYILCRGKRIIIVHVVVNNAILHLHLYICFTAKPRYLDELHRWSLHRQFMMEIHCILLNDKAYVDLDSLPCKL